MRLGILSDTHDHLERLHKALALFRAQGVEIVLHAGDIVSPFMAEPFREAQLRVIAVFGNNDGDRFYLRERFAPFGEIQFGPHELELGGKRIVLLHEPRALAALAASGWYDLIVYGHTHRAEVRPGSPLVLNPGECCGWLTGQATCALVDLPALRAELVALS